MKKIGGISITLLNNGAHYSFINNALILALADKAVMAKAASEVETLKSAFAVEDEMLGVSRKSLLTDEIIEANKERTALYIGYKNAVKSFLNMPGKDMAEAAKVLLQQIKDYRISAKYQLDKKTGLLMNLIDDLEKNHSEQVATLSLTPFVSSMKAANMRVRSLIQQRSDERTGISVRGLKKARFATDAAYRALIDKVNALALVFGDKDYSNFIDYMNTEIARYKREVLGRKSSATAEEDKEEDSPEDKPAEEDTPTPDDDYGA